MLPILDHVDGTVRPALKKYAEAEAALTAAHKTGDQAAIAEARRDVMLAARQAVDVLHHLSDFVLKEPVPQLPPFQDVGQVRVAVTAHCVFLRNSAIPVDDIALLRDVAEVFKHHKPDRKANTVASSKHIVTLGSGWGEMSSGEGKYGGAEQVLVIRIGGDKRALSSILQNSFDAWMTYLGQPLPPINEF